ncbi:MAG: sigma-70 family RNA polymerase sigma factor [Candidatus Zixiibacteriota bacterium]
MDINELYQQARSGDVRAREQLFLSLSERFRLLAHHRVWNRSDEEEVAQEALAAVASGFGDLDIRESFSAWAYKVFDNRLLAYVKRRKSTRNRNEPLFEQIPAQDANDDLRGRLLDCLRKLIVNNQRYVRILNLGYQGYAMVEICERMRITKNNAYVVLSRARSLLKHCLETGKVA